MFFILNLICCIILESAAWASPCCARSPAVPMIVMDDDYTQINLGTSYVNAILETDDQGNSNGLALDSDRNATFRVELSRKISERFQLGAVLNYTNHYTRTGNNRDSQWGWGDSRFSVMYDSSRDKPQAGRSDQLFFFSTVTLPTGRSIYYAQSDTAADVTGDGFFTTTAGGFYLKKFKAWDTMLVSELHYSIPRQFTTPDQLKVNPGLGGSLGVGLGYSPGQGPFRVGMRVQPRLDQAKIIPQIKSQVGNSSFIFITDVALDLGLAVGERQVIIFSYIDQTLLGYSINASLNRIGVLIYQFRWPEPGADQSHGMPY